MSNSNTVNKNGMSEIKLNEKVFIEAKLGLVSPLSDLTHLVQAN